MYKNMYILHVVCILVHTYNMHTYNMYVCIQCMYMYIHTYMYMYNIHTYM